VENNIFLTQFNTAEFVILKHRSILSKHFSVVKTRITTLIVTSAVQIPNMLIRQ